MGFTIPGRTLTLTFDATTPYEGAEVRCRGKVDLATALQFQRVQNGDDDEAAERTLELARVFAERIILDWNLEDDDAQPIPFSAAAFLDLPFDFVNLTMAQWSAHAIGVPDPLPSPSPAGPPSAEPEVTMVAW